MANKTIFHAGLGEPEGPVLLQDGRWGVVEMSPDTGRVSVIDGDGGRRRTVVETGRPNGMVQGADGTLWVAESMNPPSLLKIGLDGSCRQVLRGGDGADFLFPNDLAFGPDGALYMTDSGIFRPQFQQARAEGRTDYTIDGKVFRIDLDSMAVQILADGLQFANGLAFGPDGALYVTATVTGLLYRYPWRADGTLGPRRDIADLVDRSRPADFVGGDGLAIGRDGLLYCAVVGQGDVTVVDPGGAIVRRIAVGGEQPTNVAFGPAGSGDLYVTVKDAGTLERHSVGVDGVPLHVEK